MISKSWLWGLYSIEVTLVTIYLGTQGSLINALKTSVRELGPYFLVLPLKFLLLSPLFLVLSFDDVLHPLIYRLVKCSIFAPSVKSYLKRC